MTSVDDRGGFDLDQVVGYVQGRDTEPEWPAGPVCSPASWPPERSPPEEAGPAGAARALRALLPEQTALSGAEQHLLSEWLDRLASDG